MQSNSRHRAFPDRDPVHQARIQAVPASWSICPARVRPAISWIQWASVGRSIRFMGRFGLCHNQKKSNSDKLNSSLIFVNHQRWMNVLPVELIIMRCVWSIALSQWMLVQFPRNTNSFFRICKGDNCDHARAMRVICRHTTARHYADYPFSYPSPCQSVGCIWFRLLSSPWRASSLAWPRSQNISKLQALWINCMLFWPVRNHR